MEVCNDRCVIDQTIVEKILDTLEKHGVSKEKAFECYDDVRFQIEARAVLLNRVPERDNQSIGYYGEYLNEIAKTQGVEYRP